MPVGADGILRLISYYSYKNQTMTNSFWARPKPDDPSPTWQAICDHMSNDFVIGVWPRMKQFMSSSVQLIATQTQVLTGGAAMTIGSYTTEFGNVSGDALPPHDAVVLSLYTQYPGRRVHGRQYLPGVPESLQNQGELTDPAVALVKNYGDWLIVQFGENGFSPYYWWGVYSRANGVTRQPGPPPFLSYSPLAHIPWDRHVVQRVLGTQRHRKIGRGM
jgi:hypothetical protein